MSKDGPIWMEHRSKNGQTINLDISFSACEKFGFFHGARVETPLGMATVLGVKDQQLYFEVDGDIGITFFEQCKNYEDLLLFGVALLEEIKRPATPPQNALDDGEYRVKRVEWEGREVYVILQNENGPCPLIAICNVLSLRREIVIEPKNNKTNSNYLIEKLANFLLKKHPDNIEVIQLIEMLPQFQYGLDVNCGFDRVDHFEKTIGVSIFHYLRIPLLHGWIAGPASGVDKMIKDLTYNDLLLKLLQEEPAEGENPSAFKPHEAEMVRLFLDRTSSQLTDEGLIALQAALPHHELGVLFRNNHFLVITHHNPRGEGRVGLVGLVTDVGYTIERNVVWESLVSVDGNSIFYSSDFATKDDKTKEEIISTALLCGFRQNDIEEAIRLLHKPGTELKTEDVLQYLYQKQH